MDEEADEESDREANGDADGEADGEAESGIDGLTVMDGRSFPTGDRREGSWVGWASATPAKVSAIGARIKRTER